MVLPENFCRDAAEGEKEECFLREYKQSKRKGLIAFITVIVLLACVFVASFCIGRFSITPIRVLQSILIPFVVGIVPIIALRWKLNVLSFGENEAKAMGVNVAAVRLVCIICATLLTAAVVSIAGTIGWVGLMIPHLVRFLVGPNNKALIPLSLLTGGLFMLIIDNFCRSLMAYEIPLGVLTSLLGAPFFIFILYKRRGAS
jgi:predicted ABC-type iron (III) transport system, permease component